MQTFTNTLGRTTAIATATAALLGAMLIADPSDAAHAAASSHSSSEVVVSSALEEFSPDQIDQAIKEAKLSGHVVEETINADGSVATTLDLGEGFVFDLVRAAPTSRLGAGRDSKGTYVSFNSTDQNMIISGATYAIGAALCLVSGGTFCVIAGAIITAATVAITSNGGVRCSGGKSLRVYPFAGGKVKPRCA